MRRRDRRETRWPDSTAGPRCGVRRWPCVEARRAPAMWAGGRGPTDAGGYGSSGAGSSSRPCVPGSGGYVVRAVRAKRGFSGERSLGAAGAGGDMVDGRALELTRLRGHSSAWSVGLGQRGCPDAEDSFSTAIGFSPAAVTPFAPSARPRARRWPGSSSCGDARGGRPGRAAGDAVVTRRAARDTVLPCPSSSCSSGVARAAPAGRGGTATGR